MGHALCYLIIFLTFPFQCMDKLGIVNRKNGEQDKSFRTAKDVALVLSSGGARGLAHIGAIEELEAQGYRITSIAGCSMGALIGGVYEVNPESWTQLKGSLQFSYLGNGDSCLGDIEKIGFIPNAL